MSKEIYHHKNHLNQECEWILIKLQMLSYFIYFQDFIAESKPELQMLLLQMQITEFK